ncbi:RNA ligase family protein [Micromonospora sp. NPDC049240]|uniref:RNA ligase family protein n=1 Tax=Micromonospora sp. NPDC049240 TaxID=3155151 RepID=UPI0033D3DFD4
MKINPPKNPNYAATVVRVRHINQLANCDNVVGVPLLGYQAIVSKDTQEGDLGILFGAETQLSLEYASSNNLHRHENLNVDPSQKGYLEDNRRVKALKFRGHRSDALFMPLSSLEYLSIDVSQLKEGDTFDQLDGQEICRKYEAKVPSARGAVAVKSVRKQRVDDLMLPKHFDTANYFRVAGQIKPEDQVVITQKLHGTSVRIGHTLVERKLSWLERAARKLGVKVRETEWAYVYGSRSVIKDPENPFAKGEFYGTDLYTQVGSRLTGLLPKGYVVYGEIVGWVPDTNTPIQKGYTYRIPEGLAELYIYRVTTVNEDGRQVDLSWPAVKEFCQSVGLQTVPELISDYHLGEDFVSNLLDTRLANIFLNALPTDGSMVDEGVCLRVEGLTPFVVKAKSPEFLRHESKMLDKGVLDVEAAEDVIL